MRRRLPLLALALAVGVLAAARVGLAAAPGDVTLKRTAPETPDMVPVSVFSHWKHRMRFTCNVCHPALFPMKSEEAPPITMDGIKAGKACGACHNGRGSFGSTVDTCGKCHPRELD